jgi:23S rRNA-/tRNA-specific pseudouridylate synthase
VGLPIVGDYLYNEKFKIQNSKWYEEQMQLTAWKLEFLDNEWEMIMVHVW